MKDICAICEDELNGDEISTPQGEVCSSCYFEELTLGNDLYE